MDETMEKICENLHNKWLEKQHEKGLYNLDLEKCPNCGGKIFVTKNKKFVACLGSNAKGCGFNEETTAKMLPYHKLSLDVQNSYRVKAYPILTALRDLGYQL